MLVLCKRNIEESLFNWNISVGKSKFPNNTQASWRPSCSVEVLHKRAKIMASIRQFFTHRQVLEVETPCLSQHSVTDPHLHALHTLHTPPGGSKAHRLYLQTSPEYAMKRLLAAGAGDIFQISKAFRDDEVGRHHNPEFTLLEWYRLGYSMQALIDESLDLLKRVLGLDTAEQYTYQSLFEDYCGVNPHTISLTDLLELAKQLGLSSYIESLRSSSCRSDSFKHDILLKDSILQVIFNQEIETKIGRESPAVVTHFPASQAALATLNNDGVTANRFEIYFRGLELANGFNELTDAKIQAERFFADNKARASLGLMPIEVDANFIAALQEGLPPCSGIAMGIDRVIMLALDKAHISEVLSFSHDRC